MIYQFSCFKAIYEISALRNYNASVLGRHGSLYHYSIQEVYISIETKTLHKLHKHRKCNFVLSPDHERAIKSIRSSEATATPIKRQQNTPLHQYQTEKKQ